MTGAANAIFGIIGDDGGAEKQDSGADKDKSGADKQWQKYFAAMRPAETETDHHSITAAIAARAMLPQMPQVANSEAGGGEKQRHRH